MKKEECINVNIFFCRVIDSKIREALTEILTLNTLLMMSHICGTSEEKCKLCVSYLKIYTKTQVNGLCS